MIFQITFLHSTYDDLEQSNKVQITFKCLYLKYGASYGKSLYGIVGSPPKHFGDWCSHTSGS